MYNFYIAQFFGIMGIFFSVLSMQMKNKKTILWMLIGLNLSSSLNFLFLDRISGSYICFFGVIETIINYLFERKNKSVPLWTILLYIIINILLGLSTYNGVLDIIPIVCAILYCISISVKKAQNVRNIMFANQTLWLVFDIIVKAYMFACSNILTLISYIVAIIRFKAKNIKE